MKLIVCSVLAGLGLIGSVARADNSATETNHVVVMISVDGLAGYYLDDPKATIPTLRALAREGARASSMRASTPTVTWPNHTTLVTGVNPALHGVVGNNYLDRTTGEHVQLIADPLFDKGQIVKVPTIYDLAKSNGMHTAALRWPATRRAKTLDWAVPDMGTSALMATYGTPELTAEMTAMGIPIKADMGDAAAPSDMDLAHVFDMILAKHRPQLALLHVTRVDHQEHRYGPQSPEAYTAVQNADEQVKVVWDELKKDYPGRATLVVVSDHGFSSVTRLILPNIVLRNAGLIKGSNLKKQSVSVVVQGGAAFIYILDQKNYNSLLEKARAAFSKVEGVSKVIGLAEYAQYGVANPKDDPHAPDLIAFAAEGGSFGDTAAGALPFQEKPERAGSHGHDANLPDLHATFIAWGEGIKEGVNLGEITNTSVAPTLAKLLHIEMPTATGTPLEAALK